jgi:antitoxin component YwqK of YwqJK toxin-antitoxin module
MKAFSFALMLIFTFVSCEKVDIETNQFLRDPNLPILKNKLKTTREILQGNNARTEYYYNSSGYLTKTEVYSGNVLEQTTIYERNGAGQKTKSYSYPLTSNEPATSPPSKIRTYTLYEYESNKLIKQLRYQNGTLVRYTEHFYENDQLTESRDYENDQLTRISRAEYDSSGRVVQNSSYDDEEKFNGAVRYEYKQDTTLFISISANGVEKDPYYQEIYNSRGQVIEEGYLWGIPVSFRVTLMYFYNEDNLLEERHYFDAGISGSDPMGINVFNTFKSNDKIK